MRNSCLSRMQHSVDYLVVRVSDFGRGERTSTKSWSHSYPVGNILVECSIAAENTGNILHGSHVLYDKRSKRYSSLIEKLISMSQSTNTEMSTKGLTQAPMAPL